jgi:hypothetical protein
MIASHIFFENEIYQNIEAFTEDDGCRYFIGLGRTSSKQIEFSNIDLEENPFQEFIAIFRRKKIDDNKVCDWIRKYGFLNTTYGGISHSRKFEYN